MCQLLQVAVYQPIIQTQDGQLLLENGTPLNTNQLFIGEAVAFDKNGLNAVSAAEVQHQEYEANNYESTVANSYDQIAHQTSDPNAQYVQVILRTENLYF